MQARVFEGDGMASSPTPCSLSVPPPSPSVASRANDVLTLSPMSDKVGRGDASSPASSSPSLSNNPSLGSVKTLLWGVVATAAAASVVFRLRTLSARRDAKDEGRRRLSVATPREGDPLPAAADSSSASCSAVASLQRPMAGRTTQRLQRDQPAQPLAAAGATADRPAQAGEERGAATPDTWACSESGALDSVSGGARRQHPVFIAFAHMAGGRPHARKSPHHPQSPLRSRAEERRDQQALAENEAHVRALNGELFPASDPHPYDMRRLEEEGLPAGAHGWRRVHGLLSASSASAPSAKARRGETSLVSRYLQDLLTGSSAGPSRPALETLLDGRRTPAEERIVVRDFVCEKCATGPRTSGGGASYDTATPNVTSTSALHEDSAAAVTGSLAACPAAISLSTPTSTSSSARSTISLPPSSRQHLHDEDNEGWCCGGDHVMSTSVSPSSNSAVRTASAGSCSNTEPVEQQGVTACEDAATVAAAEYDVSSSLPFGLSRATVDVERPLHRLSAPVDAASKTGHASLSGDAPMGGDRASAAAGPPSSAPGSQLLVSHNSREDGAGQSAGSSKRATGVLLSGSSAAAATSATAAPLGLKDLQRHISHLVGATATARDVLTMPAATAAVSRDASRPRLTAASTEAGVSGSRDMTSDAPRAERTKSHAGLFGHAASQEPSRIVSTMSLVAPTVVPTTDQDASSVFTVVSDTAAVASLKAPHEATAKAPTAAAAAAASTAADESTAKGNLPQAPADHAPPGSRRPSPSPQPFTASAATLSTTSVTRTAPVAGAAAEKAVTPAAIASAAMGEPRRKMTIAEQLEELERRRQRQWRLTQALQEGEPAAVCELFRKTAAAGGGGGFGDGHSVNRTAYSDVTAEVRERRSAREEAVGTTEDRFAGSVDGAFSTKATSQAIEKGQGRRMEEEEEEGASRSGAPNALAGGEGAAASTPHPRGGRRRRLPLLSLTAATPISPGGGPSPATHNRSCSVGSPLNRQPSGASPCPCRGCPSAASPSSSAFRGGSKRSPQEAGCEEEGAEGRPARPVARGRERVPAASSSLSSSAAAAAVGHSRWQQTATSAVVMPVIPDSARAGASRSQSSTSPALQMPSPVTSTHSLPGTSAPPRGDEEHAHPHAHGSDATPLSGSSFCSGADNVAPGGEVVAQSGQTKESQDRRVDDLTVKHRAGDTAPYSISLTYHDSATGISHTIDAASLPPLHWERRPVKSAGSNQAASSSSATSAATATATVTATAAAVRAAPHPQQPLGAAQKGAASMTAAAAAMPLPKRAASAAATAGSSAAALTSSMTLVADAIPAMSSPAVPSVLPSARLAEEEEAAAAAVARRFGAPLPPTVPTRGPRLQGVAGRRGEMRIGAFLGGGACGKVYECLNAETGQLLAAKQIVFDAKDPKVRQRLKQLELELEVLTLAAKHRVPWIVGFHGAEKRGHSVLMYLEYCEHGSLLDYMTAGKGENRETCGVAGVGLPPRPMGLPLPQPRSSADAAAERQPPVNGGDSRMQSSRSSSVGFDLSAMSSAAASAVGSMTWTEAMCPQMPPLSLLEVRRFTAQIVEALHFLHTRAYAHLDVKTANVLITGNGESRLADLGCAMRLQMPADHVAEGSAGRDAADAADESESVPPPYPVLQDHDAITELRGTALYMAPEMIRFERHRIGAPADIWSLGCVVMEMATGSAPWRHIARDKLRVLYRIGSAREALALPPLLQAWSEEARERLEQDDALAADAAVEAVGAAAAAEGHLQHRGAAHRMKRCWSDLSEDPPSLPSPSTTAGAVSGNANPADEEEEEEEEGEAGQSPPTHARRLEGAPPRPRRDAGTNPTFSRGHTSLSAVPDTCVPAALNPSPVQPLTHPPCTMTATEEETMHGVGHEAAATTAEAGAAVPSSDETHRHDADTEPRRTLQLYVALEDFVACCMRIHPEDRSSTADLLQHPFLTL